MSGQLLTWEMVATVQRERLDMGAHRSQVEWMARAGQKMGLMAGARQWFTALRPRTGRTTAPAGIGSVSIAR